MLKFFLRVQFPRGGLDRLQGELKPRFASVNQLQRELDLAGGSGGFADDPESASPQDVGRQSKVHQVEHVKKLSAKFHGAEFRVATAAEGGVLDQGHVVLLKAGTAERVASQGAEAAVVGSGAAGNIDWNIEERGVVGALPEIVLAHRAAGGEVRLLHQVGPVGSTRPHSGLLNSGVHGERRPTGEGCDIQELPAT